MPFSSRLATDFIDAGGGLAMRALRLSDMTEITRMLRDPEVLRWYGDADEAQEEIEELLDSDYVSPFLVLMQNQPVGHLQAYHANRDDFWSGFGVPAETFGLDMFLAHGRGKGWGTHMCRAMIDHLWTIPDIVRVQIDPSPDNPRAIRAYEKAGFTPQGIFPAYDSDEEMLYMTIDRNQTSGGHRPAAGS
jgi:RimJ/RimL family protein N-acetyltransferase